MKAVAGFLLALNLLAAVLNIRALVGDAQYPEGHGIALFLGGMATTLLLCIIRSDR